MKQLGSQTFHTGRLDDLNELMALLAQRELLRTTYAYVQDIWLHTNGDNALAWLKEIAAVGNYLNEQIGAESQRLFALDSPDQS